MTTATAPAATIEQQIRDRIKAPREEHNRSAYDIASDAFGSAFHDLYVTAIDYANPGSVDEPEDDDDSMWTDLRPSQVKRLNDLIEQLYHRQDAVLDSLVEAIVQAGVTFASEYPDAARVREAVTA